MADGVQPKSRQQPSKLKKTPLQLVISSDPSGSCQQGPIGTPPPISLRKCRQDDPSVAVDQQGTVGSSSSGASSSFFPQISVERCSEEIGGGGDDDENEFAYPSPVMPSEGRSDEVTFTDDGLTPPQRLLTRDGDGIVFELSHGLRLHVADDDDEQEEEVKGQGDGN